MVKWGAWGIGSYLSSSRTLLSIYYTVIQGPVALCNFEFSGELDLINWSKDFSYTGSGLDFAKLLE
jgi:hypothetical protein